LNIHNLNQIACTNPNILNETSRSEDFDSQIQGLYCDRADGKFGSQSPGWKGPGWYQFAGRAGHRMADSPLSLGKCGTYAPGYINATHQIKFGTYAPGYISATHQTNLDNYL